MNFATKNFLNRTREKLSETTTGTLNAATMGIQFVLQHPATGAVISARTGFWTCNLSEAYGVGPDTPAILGAEVVAVEEARKVVLEKIAEATAELEAELAAG